MSYLNFAMKGKRRDRKTQMQTDGTDCSFPYCSRYFPTVPSCFERPTYAIIFADVNRKNQKQQTIKQDKIMNYYVITESNWAKLRDEILSLAECCHKAFGEKSKHTDWLHNGDVCRLLNISKRTLQHYRDTGILPFTQIGHKCYYKREDVEQLLLARTERPKNNSI